MDNTTILICDDNEAIHESLRIFLQSEGMACISAYSGEEVFEICKRSTLTSYIKNKPPQGL